MLNPNLSALSMSALKALAADCNVAPAGDKRAKQSWIDAIELFQSCETIIDDGWVAPETISDAEMKAVAHAADVNHADSYDSSTSRVSASNKKGAATVFGALLIVLVLVVQAVLYVGSAAIQVAVHVCNLLGFYNPNYDLFGRLQNMARAREASPVQQSQQPAC